MHLTLCVPSHGSYRFYSKKQLCKKKGKRQENVKLAFKNHPQFGCQGDTEHML